MKTEDYFEKIGKKIEENYEKAREARAKGYDPSDEVEVSLALTMAAKVVKLISTVYPQLDREDIVNRILELEKQYGALETSVAFKIAEEIANQKYCKFKDQLEAIDAGIRVGFAYLTLGVVASPIEGYTGFKIGKTRKGESYFIPYFSGPIRSAGTTASCLCLILIDYLRQLFGYAKYDPTDNEIKRNITELYDYHERIANLQYLPTKEEIEFLSRYLPIQISGDPTEDKEVSNYKNLQRVNTDFIRGGFALMLGEGLAQKAPKGLRHLKKLIENGFEIKDWEFLEEYVKLHEKRASGSKDVIATYIQDLVAGRPVFGHPGKGFRFRYGRSRVAGFSAVSIHPATMAITDDFIATGTQLKTEKPTKGCVVTVCDSIDGPIVKLNNQSVKKLDNYEKAKEIYKDVEEIIYLGDILFPFGDVANRNAMLVNPGYVEEWWDLELKEKGFEEKIDYLDVKIEDAINLSEKFKIPLHPKYIFYWTQINYEQFLGLIDWLNHSAINNKKLILAYGKQDKERFKTGKRALELLGVPHEVAIENVVLNETDTKALLVNLGFNVDCEKIDFNSFDFKKTSKEQNVLETINELSKFKIKDKAGEFVGSRMGRPEKAKLRKLIGSPNILFPVGKEGGRLRSVNEAVNLGNVKGDFPFYYCEKCNKETIFRKCEDCNERTIQKYYCDRCGKQIIKKCEMHNKYQKFKNKNFDIKNYFLKAVENLNLSKYEIPVLIKGVRGTSSESHQIEALEKGILRAKHNLQVNKDGTIRYDVVELPITHFKPKEIEVSIEKLKEIGYMHDYLGKELNDENQILELKPHDIIVPCNVKCGDEKADDVFINVANFIDELLVRFYKIKPFYNVKSREDLVGKLGVCMAPHNCAGVICRIIGFSKIQGLYASPYMHAAIRRDCDGDEAAIMLLLDVLINFSKQFLPSHRGGTQDAPLVLNGKIRAKEIDAEILDFELCSNYPLKLYELSEQGKHSSEVKVETVKDRLKTGNDLFSNTGFTHNTSDFNDGATCSSYKTLPTMQEKVKKQMELCMKLRSVEQGDVARLIIDRHFMRDLKGNLRKFSQQAFRCSTCNESFRRPPLDGKCTKCNGRIIFTIAYGSIVKYLEPALELARNYNVPAYIKQDLELTKKYIESIFGKETEKQEALEKWF